MALHLVTGYSGKAHITSADQGALHAAVFGRENNVLNAGNCFAATVVTNNSIEVKDGEAIMQGRQIRMESGDFESVTIENGTQGQKRNDLICIRYTKDSNTGIESASFVVIKGASDASAAVDPAYNAGNILDGALIVDFPLYRVPLDGLNVGELVPLFEVVDNFDERLKAIIDGIVAVGNALKLGGKTAEEWQEAIDNSFDGDADSLGGETAEEWNAKFDNYLPLNPTEADVLRNLYIHAVDESGEHDTGFGGNIRMNVSYEEASKNKFRIFENGGSYRGTFIDFSKCPNISTGAEILHTGNKPKGTYTGNGSATTRTIDIGNSDHVLIEVASTCMLLVGLSGAFCFNKNGTITYYQYTQICTYQGKMHINTADANINGSGLGYKWIAL